MGNQAHAIAGWHEETVGSSVKDKMQFVAEVKGFDYGIFWKFTPGKKCFAFHESVLIKSTGSDTMGGGSLGGQHAHAHGLSLFIQSSMTMFATWIMGFGTPGRVGYTGNYEWHEEVTSLPGWSFQRLRQAQNASLRTVIGGAVHVDSP